MLQILECSLKIGSDNFIMAVCQLAVNSIRKQYAPAHVIQAIKHLTSNSLTTLPQKGPTQATIPTAYQPSI